LAGRGDRVRIGDLFLCRTDKITPAEQWPHEMLYIALPEGLESGIDTPLPCRFRGATRPLFLFSRSCHVCRQTTHPQAAEYALYIVSRAGALALRTTACAGRGPAAGRDAHQPRQ